MATGRTPFFAVFPLITENDCSNNGYFNLSFSHIVYKLLRLPFHWLFKMKKYKRRKKFALNIYECFCQENKWIECVGFFLHYSLMVVIDDFYFIKAQAPVECFHPIHNNVVVIIKNFFVKIINEFWWIRLFWWFRYWGSGREFSKCIHLNWLR